MNRITENMLKKEIEWLNEISGTSLEYAERDADGNYLGTNIGHYSLYICHGIYALDQTTNRAGGVRRVLTGCTKRELWDQLLAYVDGISIQNQQKGVA